jgi:hypothetical protein
MPNTWVKSLPKEHTEAGKKAIWVLRDPKGGKSEYRFIDAQQAKNRELIFKITIDGGIITSSTTPKADYLLVRETSLTCSIIELKGKDVEHACVQVLETYNALKNSIKHYNVNIRIVATRISIPDIRSTSMTRLKTIFKAPNAIEYRSGRIIEDHKGIK